MVPITSKALREPSSIKGEPGLKSPLIYNIKDAVRFVRQDGVYVSLKAFSILSKNMPSHCGNHFLQTFDSIIVAEKQAFMAQSICTSEKHEEMFSLDGEHSSQSNRTWRNKHSHRGRASFVVRLHQRGQSPWVIPEKSQS